MPPLSVSHTFRRVRALIRPSDESQTFELRREWRGSGPVVLVGGFATAEPTLEPLKNRLGQLGYTVTTYTAGGGMDCGRRSVDSLADVVRAAADAHGSRVRLLGYSRGGQFARALAMDPTMPVRSLVTLGTPFDVYGVSVPLRLQAAALAVAGAVPGRRRRVATRRRHGRPDRLSQLSDSYLKEMARRTR